MASLKDLKLRIKSVKSTQKITKAMKMVAASKLRRAREAAEASRPYAEKLEAMIGRLSASLSEGTGPELMRGTGRNKSHLLVICTADRGLCGGFNGSILRAAKRQVNELQAAGKKVSLFCVGKKSYDLLPAELKPLVIARKSELAKKTVPYSVAEAIGDKVLEAFAAGECDRVSVLYNHFKSAIQQVVTLQQIIPLANTITASAPADSTPYMYEPEEEAILADLLPRNVHMQIYKALLESSASEQGARMNAMENATRNAGDMIKKLTLKYNRTRQANITKELIEIISGAEAV
jgi:F-type H+-transporting ATPase subunit gamma